MERDCDICKHDGTTPPFKATVDRQTIFQSWAYMCDAHNQELGVGPATILANIK